MDQKDIALLKEKSLYIRRLIIQMLTTAGSGHLGGSLSCTDILTTLYFKIMKHDPQNPTWEDRDRFVLSIGHVAPAFYATLACVGYFPEKELFNLRKLGSMLQGHPSREHQVPGLETSSGSLGQGLGIATGIALALKLKKNTARVFCLLGDGELQEGSIWESAMSAAHYKLTNLVAIIDRNGVQIDGKTENVMSLEPLAEKWQSFGWYVSLIHGHDFEAIYSSLSKNPDRPHVVIAQTIMGKGIPSIEGNHLWHGKAPTPDEIEKFLKELY
ncbi:MAG: transketolase [Bacteroidales bacterium]|nr:transketolase [Bacteroidales bacterium]